MKLILPCIILTPLFKKSWLFLPLISMLLMLLSLSFPWHISTLSNNLFFMDLLSMSMIFLTLVSVMLIFISSFNPSSISLIMSLIFTFLILSFSSSSSLSFYIFFETVLIPTFMLITLHGKAPERLQAGIYILMYTIFGSLPLLLGFILFSDTSSFMALKSTCPSFYPPIIFMMAFLAKFPMFFFHLWLPKAHVEAPLEGSMILAAVLLKLGGFGLIRLAPYIQFMPHFINSSLISISILGAFFTSMNCLRQKDLKALIAYSSVAHMALVISAILTFKSLGLQSAILMMMAHGLTSSALFFLVTILYNNTHTRNILSFKASILTIPNLTFWWFLFSATNISAPPSFNFIGEMLIISSIIHLNIINMPFIFLAALSTASFSLILYANISHNFSNSIFPFSPSSNKSFLSLFLHFLPIIFISSKSELFSHLLSLKS